MENVNNGYKNTEISELLESFTDILPGGYEGYSDPSELADGGISDLLGELYLVLCGRGSEVLSFFLLLVGITLLCSMAYLVSTPMRHTVSGALCAVVSLLLFGTLYPLFRLVCDTLADVGEFFRAAAPVLLSYVALGGGATVAATSATGLNLCAWLLGVLSGELLLPVTVTVFASSAISASLGGVSKSVSASANRIFKRIIGILGASLSALFALQTYVSSAADGAAMRAARYAAGGLIPAVGTAVSGAISTLVGGLSSVGGIIGASSVFVIAAMALSPLLVLLLYRLAFYLASLIGEFTGFSSSVLSAFSSSLDSLVSVYTMTTTVYILEIILLILGGNAVIGAW